MIVESQFVTISCDGVGCGNNATFAANPEAKKEAEQDYPWLLTLRTVASAQGRRFAYCSDECEAKGIGSGEHNPKKIIAEGNNNSVELAARAAAQARLTTQQLKQGR